ncbi:MAG TPA: hypothetical protein VF385_00200 [Patescibacteria group bacterium]
MVRFLDQDPIPKIFNWPVKYRLNSNYLSSKNIELRIQFDKNNTVKLSDKNEGIYNFKLFKGYTIVGGDRYGGNNTECFFCRVIGTLGEMDLFSVIPLMSFEFKNMKSIKILPPGPIKKEDITITPEPLTIFQQFSFNSLSKRIFKILKPPFY